MRFFKFVFFTSILLLYSCRKEESTDGSPVPTGSPVIVTADEGSSTLSLFSAIDLSPLGNIDLGHHEGMMVMPHNVQAAPGGQFVYVTAMPAGTGDHEEELIEIHIPTRKITRRLNLGHMMHLAHVVCDPTGNLLYVSSTMKNEVLVIDRHRWELSNRVSLGSGRGPHGLRENLGSLYIANISGRSLSIADPKSMLQKEVFLGGMAMQTAVESTGKKVYVSLFDTKAVAVVETEKDSIRYIPLPGAQGPVQLALSNDESMLVVCDQGYDYGQPISNRVYLIDTKTLEVSRTLYTQAGPHGVVMEPGRNNAFVTCKLNGVVLKINLNNGEITHTAETGTMPNGITWLSNLKGN